MKYCQSLVGELFPLSWLQVDVIFARAPCSEIEQAEKDYASYI